MIRGEFVAVPGRSRPFVPVTVVVPSQGIVGEIGFLIDTGADVSALAPADAERLGLETTSLPQDTSSTGVGGRAPTTYVDAIVRVGDFSFALSLRVLVLPANTSESALARFPSLLGRDILSHFALFLEERTGRVLLLEAEEADRLSLPA